MDFILTGLFILIIGTAVTEADATTRQDHDESAKDIPEIKLYYETMCPGCRRFDSNYFAQLVSSLGPHLHIQTYPYGKASTTVHYNGSVEFACQHGPAECYGNTLHACALNTVPERDRALLFNACLMHFDRAQNGSDDNAADECGSKMAVDVKPIKECAKGSKGIELLEHIADESVVANYKSLPHLLINGRLWTGDHKNLIHDVCAVYENPPKACQDAKAE